VAAPLRLASHLRTKAARRNPKAEDWALSRSYDWQASLVAKVVAEVSAKAGKGVYS